MQDPRACDGGDEDDGSATARMGLLHHVAAAGLGDDEGTGEVDIDKSAKRVHIVRFGFDVRATQSRYLYLSVIVLLVSLPLSWSYLPPVPYIFYFKKKK